MGRRELLIALAFAAVGIVAWQLTAPAGESTSPAPFRERVAEFRREIRGDAGRASYTHTGTVAVGPGITEVRLPPVNALTLQGEPRDDLSYEFTIQTAGPDNQAALERARTATLSADTFGHVLALQHARQPQSSTTLSVRVPPRLAVRLEGSRRATVANVAGVHLDGLVGDARLSGAGAVWGTHRSGTLAISGASRVDLELTGSRASLDDIAGAISLTGRGGAVAITDPAGTVQIDGIDLDMLVTRPRRAVRITGTNGTAVIDRPEEAIDIDGERLAITVTLASAVAVTAVTSERELRLIVEGEPAITIDAATSRGGTIDARAIAAAPARTGDGEHVRQTLGGTVAVALRNDRGAIVIGRTK